MISPCDHAARTEIGCGGRNVPELSKNRIEGGERSLWRCRDFDPDCLALSREIDHEPRFDPARSHALLIRLARQVIVGRDGSAMPKRHFKL